MRMRKKKWVEPFLNLENRYLLRTTEDLQMKLPLNAEKYLEIGCGMGDFIVGTAQENPQNYYVAMEKDPSCVAKSIKKAAAMDLKNVFFICDDANNLEKWFTGFIFSGLFLLFSDPWHKNAHFKRRLTYRKFLKEYEKYLAHDGFIYFKTDNKPLFDFTVQEIDFVGFKVKHLTCDFHSEFPGGIMTMYEQKFVAEGKPIYHILFSVNNIDGNFAD